MMPWHGLRISLSSGSPPLLREQPISNVDDVVGPLEHPSAPDLACGGPDRCEQAPSRAIKTNGDICVRQSAVSRPSGHGYHLIVRFLIAMWRGMFAVFRYCLTVCGQQTARL